MIITCPNCSTRYSLPQDKIKPGGQKVRCAKCGTVWYQEPETLELTTADALQVPGPSADAAWGGMPPASEPIPHDSAPAGQPAPEPSEADSGPAADAAPDVPLRDFPPPGESLGQYIRKPPVEEESSGAARKWAIAIVVLVIVALAGVVVFRQQIQDLTGIQLMPAPKAETAAPAAALATPAAAPVPEAPQPLTLTFEEVESSIEEIDGVRKLMVKGLIVNPADREQAVPGLAFDMLDKQGKSIDRWTFSVPVRALAPHTTTRFTAQRETPPAMLNELVPGFDVPENPPPVPAPTSEAAAGAATEGLAPEAATPPPAQPQ
jgi:predicted Zn finger-like uncharacterized protein